mmetsp:Transcript_8043/g.29762  ORF Transcript_8043/g.29762 Transcript_8043/m.29762 type:complete len:244 (-) Transcript_8043:350-1081(-)
MQDVIHLTFGRVCGCKNVAHHCMARLFLREHRRCLPRRFFKHVEKLLQVLRAHVLRRRRRGAHRLFSFKRFGIHVLEPLEIRIRSFIHGCCRPWPKATQRVLRVVAAQVRRRRLEPPGVRRRVIAHRLKHRHVNILFRRKHIPRRCRRCLCLFRRRQFSALRLTTIRRPLRRRLFLAALARLTRRRLDAPAPTRLHHTIRLGESSIIPHTTRVTQRLGPIRTITPQRRRVRITVRAPLPGDAG